MHLLLKASGRAEFHQPPGPGLLRRMLQELRGKEVQRLPKPHHRLLDFKLTMKLFKIQESQTKYVCQASQISTWFETKVPIGFWCDHMFQGHKCFFSEFKGTLQSLSAHPLDLTLLAISRGLQQNYD